MKSIAFGAQPNVCAFFDSKLVDGSIGIHF
jgi:hypothetical protein